MFLSRSDQIGGRAVRFAAVNSGLIATSIDDASAKSVGFSAVRLIDFVDLLVGVNWAEFLVWIARACVRWLVNLLGSLDKLVILGSYLLHWI